MVLAGLFMGVPGRCLGIAAGGGPFAFTAGRMEDGFAARPDFSAVDSRTLPRSYLAHENAEGKIVPARFYIASLVHDPEALRLLLKLFGANRVALGSDYPFPLGEERAGALVEAMTDLSAPQRSQILAGTCQEFLALPEFTPA